MSNAELPRLVSMLIGIQPLADVVRAPLADATAREIAELRAGHPTVAWCGVNQRRVDFVVQAGDDEWRIVYFTDDGTTIDALTVFRRPPQFAGVEHGRAVIVNGPSSSGKSSVLDAIAGQSSLPWVVFDEPLMGAVAQPYLIWREQAPALHRGFLDAIAALARRGNLVALSAAGHPAALFDEAFDGIPTLRIGLDCDRDTLIARERGRDGRWGGLAMGSLNDHDGWEYDARFDTTELSSAVIAQRVHEVFESGRG